MDVREVGCEESGWIRVVRGGVQCQAVVGLQRNTGIKSQRKN
jgi:hypothetical protein